MDNKTIGEFIHQLRIAKGMTQQELADKLNVTNKAISKWECGRGCPDISLFEQLSDILEVSVIELLNGKYFEEEPPQQEILKTSIDYSDKLVKENNHHLNIRMVVLSVAVIVVFGFFVVPFISNILGFPQYTTPIYTPLIQDQKPEKVDYYTKPYFDSLSTYQTPYIGDNSKVGNLIRALPLNEYGYSTEILSEDLQLNVYYHDVSWNINNLVNDQTFYQKAVLYNTLAAFNYVDNMEAIQFYFSDTHFYILRQDFKQLFSSENSSKYFEELTQWFTDEKIINEKMNAYRNN